MNSNSQLVQYLVNTEALKTDIIINAFNKIDRKKFVQDDFANEPYQDIPLPIWYWQTISQPTTVAFMLELLSPENWDKILDIWTGSWWTTALLANIVWDKWLVKWYELIPELVEFGRDNLKKYNFKNASINQSEENFSFIKWDFDKILVSAWSYDIPKELIKKLKIWWTMVIPVDSYIYKITKINEKPDLDIDKYYGFAFVPLITN